MAKAVVPGEAQRERHLETLSRERRWPEYEDALQRSPHARYVDLYSEFYGERLNRPARFVSEWAGSGKLHAIRWIVEVTGAATRAGFCRGRGRGRSGGVRLSRTRMLSW